MERCGYITVEEAREMLKRFVASHFHKHDEEHARASIPANVSRDDDLRMHAFIDWVEAERKVVEAARKWRRDWNWPSLNPVDRQLAGAVEELEKLLRLR